MWLKFKITHVQTYIVMIISHLLHAYWILIHTLIGQREPLIPISHPRTKSITLHCNALSAWLRHGWCVIRLRSHELLLSARKHLPLIDPYNGHKSALGGEGAALWSLCLSPARSASVLRLLRERCDVRLTWWMGMFQPRRRRPPAPWWGWPTSTTSSITSAATALTSADSSCWRCPSTWCSPPSTLATASSHLFPGKISRVTFYRITLYGSWMGYSGWCSRKGLIKPQSCEAWHNVLLWIHKYC